LWIFQTTEEENQRFSLGSDLLLAEALEAPLSSAKIRVICGEN